MAMAIRMHALGGPEVLNWEQVNVPAPGEGELRLQQTAVGLNYSDIYYRIGFYKTNLPAVIGAEAAGIVEAVGPKVEGIKPGDRVAYAPLLGAYAQSRNIPARIAVPLPSWISDEQAAAAMLKGLTARILVREVHPVG